MVKKDVQTHIQVPLLNNSHHNAVLEPKVTRGSLHQIQSISPSEPLKLWNKKKQQFAHQSNTANTTQNHKEGSSVGKRGKSAYEHVQEITREVYLQGID